ncbi:MAG: hypothetical protein ABI885_27490 [Gammaproteobacteria bacterium]
MKPRRSVAVHHHLEQEHPKTVRRTRPPRRQADSCAARLLSEAFPERGALAQTVKGFLDQMTPAAATAVLTKNGAGTSAAGTATAMASAVPACRPATSAKAAQVQEEANQVASVLKTLSEIVQKPQSRHPDALERKTNLEEILNELAQPAQATS